VEALANLVGGTVNGDGALHIGGAKPITEAGVGDITFVENDRNARRLRESSATAAVVSPDFNRDGLALTLIHVQNPREAFTRIAQHLQGTQRRLPPGVHPLAVIAPSARLGSAAMVGPFVAIGEEVVVGDRCQFMPGAVIGAGCRLGDDVVLHARAILYPGTVLGNRVVVHAGAVLGADGFGYRQQGKQHAKVPQLGHVELGDDVEIGANTTIDCATFEATRIGAGTKIDNLVQVAHNCQIGRNNLIVSQVGIAGSCQTGDDVVIAGQAGIRDHITIGDGAVIGAMSGVMKDIPAGARVVGIPATPEREQYQLVAMVHKLPELRGRLSALEKQVQEMLELHEQVIRLKHSIESLERLAEGKRKSA
jgi:UDP-3-O-[3-hydroxymyristoyl] glucosamine N-acyltransferase